MIKLFLLQLLVTISTQKNKDDDKYSNEITKISIDTCKVFESKGLNYFVKTLFVNVFKYSNLTTDCPYKKVRELKGFSREIRGNMRFFISLRFRFF